MKAKSSSNNKTRTKPVIFDTVRQIAQTLPGAEESTSYRTPAFKVKGKLFARQHQDGESLVVRVDFEEREEMMSAAPEEVLHHRSLSELPLDARAPVESPARRTSRFADRIVATRRAKESSVGISSRRVAIRYDEVTASGPSGERTA